jgi:LPXTG-motif cell wall-anchored protein
LRKILLAAAACAGLAMPAVAAFAPAAQADTTRTWTFTTHISGNLDNGHHGYWAVLDYQRVTTITGPATVGKAPVHYRVVLTDTGTFATLPGPADSPRQGLPVAAQNGRFTGTYQFDVVTGRQPVGATRASYAYRCDRHGRGDRVADCPGMPAGTSAWPALYFGGAPGGNGQPVVVPLDVVISPGGYTWTYRTCVETWVDSDSNNDGADVRAGDITGRRCPSPPPCPTATPTATPTVKIGLPRVVSPEGGRPTATATVCPTPSQTSSVSPSAAPSTASTSGTPVVGGRLPTTGASAGLLAGAGAVLVTVGGVAVWITRRRRSVG